MSAVPVSSPRAAPRARTELRGARIELSPRSPEPSGGVDPPRGRVVPRARRAAWPLGVVAFSLAAGFTFVASTLLGQSLMEYARVEARRAAVRAQSAREETARLQRRLDLLTAPRTVSSWAAHRGFVPVHGVPSDGGGTP